MRTWASGGGGGGGLQAVTGTYTGDGNATQAIVGLGFQPRFLVIYPQVDGGVGIATIFALKTDVDGTFAMTLSNAAGAWYLQDEIVSLDADGFTVGDGTGSPEGNTFNINTTHYTYMAWSG